MAAEFRRGGAEGLLNVTSDARFSSRMAEAQHLAGSRFAAVTAGLPVYRAANSGITAAIDPQGRVKERLTRGRPGILTVPWRVAPTGRDTAFVRFGHHAKTLLGGLSLLVLCAALLPRRRGTDRP
jgi:apolipoprotein N-acyltransferase